LYELLILIPSWWTVVFNTSLSLSSEMRVWESQSSAEHQLSLLSQAR